MDHRDLVRALVEVRDPEFLFARQYLASAGVDLVRSPSEARQYLEARATEGVPEAKLALSKLLAIGMGGPADDQRAFQMCKSSVDDGYIPALAWLAAFYSEGWGGVQRDLPHAIELLHTAADDGYAHAAALLASAYSNGLGVREDNAKAAHFLAQAAEGGDANSQLMLGLQLLKSADARETATGARWIKAAAEQDLSSAHRHLADLYEQGTVEFPRNPALAREHHDRASEIEQRLGNL